jgi:hypothetical protein
MICCVNKQLPPKMYSFVCFCGLSLTASQAILSAHSAPIVAVKRDAVATRLTHAVVQSIGAPIAPEVVAAIERELSVSLAERDTEVASARSESQLLLSELTDARRVIARLAESLGPAKAQQILAEASPSSSSAGHSHQPMPLTSDTLRRHNKDKPATLARGKPTVLSRRYDPLRVYDRSYVVALEKELLDTREELDDLKTAIDETEATINTLKTKFPHLQSANINLGSKSKAPDDAALDAELPPGTADDDDAASATLEAFVVWRATMAQDQLHHAAALQRPMPPIDSFAAADSSAPEFAAMPVAAAIEHDSDSDEQPPPPQEGDASMRFVPLSQMSRPVPSSPTAATAAAAPFDLVAPAKPKRSVNPPPSALAPGAPEVGSPSSPRPTPPPRAAQPTPAVPPKSPPVSPRVPRSSKPLPQLPPKSRTSTTQHPNAPAPVDEDKTPSERHETSEDGDSVRVSQRQAKPLPGLSSPDLELARQAARKPLPVAGHTVATPTSPPLPATAIATAAAALPVAKKPPMPTVARPALRVNVAAAGGVAQGPASPGSPTKRAPPTLTLPALPGFPQGQPSAYDLVPTASEMEAALVDEAAAAAAAVEVPAALTDYGKIPTFVDETQTEETVEAESEH